MEIFSSVLAAFDAEFSLYLPPQEELQNFIEQLSGCKIICSEKDRQLCILGSFKAIVSIQDSLSSFFKAKQQENSVDINDSEIFDLCDQNEFLANSTELVEQKNVEDESSLGTEKVNETSAECLNIEVLHPMSDKNIKKKDFEFSCSQCSYKSQRESHYRKHMTLHETDSTIYECGECSFKTLRFTHLRRHQVLHSARIFRCPMCNYSTDNPKLLIKHRRLKHKVLLPNSDDQTFLKCSTCAYQTTRLHLYERHMKVHSTGENSDGLNLFICNQCDYRTARKVHYVRHVRDVHRQWRPYLCDLCGKTFKRPEALKQHNLLHAMPEKTESGSTFQCLVKNCLKICHSRSHLKEHQAVHSSERLYLCEICGASFKTRSVQRKHVANLHQNPGAFHCHCCKKRFNTNYALRRHLKLHESNANARELNQAGKLLTVKLPDDGQRHRQRKCNINGKT